MKHPYEISDSSPPSPHPHVETGAPSDGRASLPSLKTSAQCSAKVRWERRVAWKDSKWLHPSMEGSINGGTPKSSIYRWSFHETNHPANGVPRLTEPWGFTKRTLGIEKMDFADFDGELFKLSLRRTSGHIIGSLEGFLRIWSWWLFNPV